MSLLATGCGPWACSDTSPEASNIDLRATKSLMTQVKHVKMELCLGGRCDTLSFSTTPKDKYGRLSHSGVSLSEDGSIFVNLIAFDLDIERGDTVSLSVTATGARGRVVAESDEDAFEFTAEEPNGKGCGTYLYHTTTLGSRD